MVVARKMPRFGISGWIRLSKSDWGAAAGSVIVASSGLLSTILAALVPVLRLLIPAPFFSGPHPVNKS